MTAAARLNWRLWTIFQANLLEPDCPLPTDIRTNVLTLANFVDQRTVKFLACLDTGMLDVLININRQLAAGLYETPKDQQAEPVANDVPPQGLGRGISA